MNFNIKMGSKTVVNYFRKYNTYIILVLLVVMFKLISPDFFTPSNFINIGRQYAGLTIVSLGMLTVILTGGIDLSVGSIVALGSVTMALSLKNGTGLLLALVYTLLMGFACGLFSGFLVSKVKMPAFVATLAMMTIARGASFMISNGYPIKIPGNVLQKLGSGTILGIPTLVLFAVLFVISGYFIFNHTSFGRIVIAIGSNEEAIYLSGIRVDLYKMAVYSISGILSVVAGIIAASRTGIGSPLYGTGMELDAIAACVIGGASLSGGQGSPVKTVVGVLVLALIGNIMNLLSIPSYPQDVIKGFIIILAVLMQVYTSSRKSKF